MSSAPSCPFCKSDDIREADYVSADNMMNGVGRLKGFFKVFSCYRIKKCAVCKSCGYVAQFLDEKALQNFRKDVP